MLTAAGNWARRKNITTSRGRSGGVLISVGTGWARLLGFRVGFVGQNPSLGTLRLSGFGPFRALGFSRLFQAFLVYVQSKVSFFSQILLLLVLLDI